MSKSQEHDYCQYLKTLNAETAINVAKDNFNDIFDVDLTGAVPNDMLVFGEAGPPSPIIEIIGFLHVNSGQLLLQIPPNRLI